MPTPEQQIEYAKQMRKTFYGDAQDSPKMDPSWFYAKPDVTVSQEQLDRIERKLDEVKTLLTGRTMGGIYVVSTLDEDRESSLTDATAADCGAADRIE
jgi:hypothetical protein